MAYATFECRNCGCEVKADYRLNWAQCGTCGTVLPVPDEPDPPRAVGGKTPPEES